MQDEADHVLVVDDDPSVCESVAVLLGSRGYAVHMAARGLEAIELANTTHPDLVLLDVQLPDVDGFEVCRRLRERWPASEMPVVFTSGMYDGNQKVRAMRLGGVDYVTKPFQSDDMLTRIQTHLELKRLQHDAAVRAKQLEMVSARLMQVEDARRSFLSAVHDLKNPLTPVLRNAEWLLSQSRTEDGETGDVLRDLYLAANQMNRMVLSLLDVARGSASTLRPYREPVAIDQWVEDAASLARLHLRTTPHRLHVAADEGVAIFDPSLMTRVLQNLLDNAIKYSPRHGPVRVLARSQRDGGLRLTVEDAGPGIPRSARERIFEPWTRCEQGNDPHARVSHGLGLAFCRSAVEAHGGHIFVEDVAPTGTRFVVEIPPPTPGWAAPRPMSAEAVVADLRQEE